MITQYRQAVVEHLRASLPGLREVATHGGVFSLDEAKRRIANSPSVYVAALGVRPGERYSNGQMSGELEMAAYVFTRNQGQLAAETQGWSMATAALAAMHGWQIEGSLEPEKLEIESLWSGELDRNGACILAVVWCVEVLLGPELLIADMEITGQVAGADGTITVTEGTGP